MSYVILQHRAVLSLAGEEVVPFLQGLISNDARALERGESIYAAMLSSQGKFLHDFFLTPWQGKILLDVCAKRADDLLARLKMYRLRSKVEIAKEDSLRVLACFGRVLKTSDMQEYAIYTDPRLEKLGSRMMGSLTALQAHLQQQGEREVGHEMYEQLRVSLCVPDTHDLIVDKSLLLEYGFEQLHGVDFSKGCYVGQEVTARSKFRGQVRKHVFAIKAEGDLPAIGAPIMAGEKLIGEMRSSYKNIGIALLNSEACEEAKKCRAATIMSGCFSEV